MMPNNDIYWEIVENIENNRKITKSNDKDWKQLRNNENYGRIVSGNAKIMRIMQTYQRNIKLIEK